MRLEAKTKKHLKTPLYKSELITADLCMHLPSKKPKTETPALEMIPSKTETVLQ